MTDDSSGKEKKREDLTKPTQEKQTAWAAIIEAVKNPLGFFALAVLICEAILTIGIAASGLEEIHKFILYCGLVALLFVLVGAVTFLTVNYPRHLNPEMAKALEKAEEFEEYVESKVFRDVVLNIVEERLKQLPPKAENEDKDKG